MLFCLIIWKIEFRFLFCFSVSKKLFFGIFYYKNKFINNKEIARIVTNDAFEIWKKEKSKEEDNSAKQADKSSGKDSKIKPFQRTVLLYSLERILRACGRVAA